MFRWLHYLGVTLVFLAAVLLLVTTISAPVVGDIGILKVMLKNQTDIRHSSVTFGTFGHCVLDVAPVQTDQDYCYPKVIGYKPAAIMSQIDGTTFSTAKADASDKLTYAFILHPIACGLAFIAALCALGGVLGGVIASMITAIAFIIALVVMAIDFAVFGIIKNNVNKDGSGSHAYYSVGMWTCLAAMILLFLGTIMLFFTCCTHRKKNKPEDTAVEEPRRSHWRRRRDEKIRSYDNTGNGGYVNDEYVNGTGNGYNGVGNTVLTSSNGVGKPEYSNMDDAMAHSQRDVNPFSNEATNAAYTGGVSNTRYANVAGYSQPARNMEHLTRANPTGNFPTTSQGGAYI